MDLVESGMESNLSSSTLKSTLQVYYMRIGMLPCWNVQPL